MFQQKRQNYAIIWLFSVLLLSSFSIPVTDVRADEGQVVLVIGYLKQAQPVAAALSNLDPVPKDLAVQGLRLAVQDNNTTGQFTGQKFLLKEVSVPIGGDVIKAFEGLLQENIKFFVTSVPASAIRELAPLAVANNVLVLDVETLNDELRMRDCSPNVLYLRPSRAMRADALAQYMLKKRWKDWFLVIGSSEKDRLYFAAIKRAAKRYGMTVVAEKIWNFSHDARRTAQSEVPCLPKVLTTTFLLLRMKRAYSANISLTEPGRHARLSVLRVWCQRLGIELTNNGAQYNCKIDLENRRSAG